MAGPQDQYQEHFNRGVELMRAGNHEQAAHLWHVVSRTYSDNGSSLLNLCFCLQKLDQKQKLWDAVRRMIMRYPDRDNNDVLIYIRNLSSFLEISESAENKPLRKRDDRSVIESLSPGEDMVMERLAGLDLGVIFDVGANIGKWLAMARKHHPAAKIHCFEILPALLDQLREGAADDPNAQINDFGLLDKEGEVDVYQHPISNLSSVFALPRNRKETLKCRVSTGDTYLKTNGIDKVDYLKLDVEGAEHLVLKGFDDALKSNALRIIQFEYGEPNLETRFLLKDYYEMFIGMDYFVGRIEPDRVAFGPYSMSYENFSAANFLAVTRDWHETLENLGMTKETE